MVSAGIALASEAASAAGGDGKIPTGQVSSEALEVIAEYGLLKPYGRGQESEADLFGVAIMAKAGYNPQGAVDLWQNMAALGGSGGPAFMSTHPSHETRIEDLNDAMADVFMVYQQAQSEGKKPKCK